MNRILIACVLASAVLFAGCLAPAFYSDIKGNSSAQPGAFTSSGGTVVTGKSCWNSYVGIYAAGDASVAAALRNAGVDATQPVMNLIVDHTVFAIAPFYVEYCTVVSVTTGGAGSGGTAKASSATPEGKTEGKAASKGESKDKSKDKSKAKSGDDSFDWKSD